MTGFTFAQLAGVSALVAATMTVVGMATLLAFFSRGGRWGTFNDAASVVLMLAMIPVALVLAAIELEVVTTDALVVAAIGIVAMLLIAILQTLLVLGRVTYEQTKAAVLGLGAIVGIWYLLTAIVSGHTDIPDGIRVAAVASGLGFIAVGYGFARGGERHPAAAIGGITLFAASLVFQVWLGALLATEALVVPDFNL